MGSLNFFVWNIRGIRGKSSQLEHRVFSRKLDLVDLSETLLEDEIDTRFFQGYNCIRKTVSLALEEVY